MSPADFLSDPLSLVPWLLRELPALAARLRPLPLWGHGLVLAGALLVLLAGARRRRPLALVGGAALGWLTGLAAAGALGLSGRLLAPIGAALLGGGALLVPSLFPFAAGALPGALVGARLGLPGGVAVGAAVGFLLLGGMGMLLARQVAAAAAGLIGGALAGVALLAAARHLPALAVLAERPVLLAGLVLVLAISGAAFQGRAAWGGSGGKAPRRPAPPPDAHAHPA